MKSIAIISSAILLLTGCSLKEQQEKTTETLIKKISTEDIKSESISSENNPFTIKQTTDLFEPPHFEIKKFAVQKMNHHTIRYIVFYSFDAEAVAYLKEHPDTFYFNISYPEKIYKISQKMHSKNVKLKISSTSSAMDSIVITDHFNSKSSIDRLTDPSSDLDLQVFDNN